MRILRCWFCSRTIYAGHGVTFVRNDGNVFQFCRSKCHKNFKMRRNPRKVRWSMAHRLSSGKESLDHKLLHFERKRDRPEKLNTSLLKKTVEAMWRVDAIRRARRDRFTLGEHLRFENNALWTVMLRPTQVSNLRI